ncbi:MAG: hypothetical protein H7Y11_01240 [Armatimonadetes bacterium]|nr:hypothetical protein [Anaerolineae bacterium]
MMTDNDYPPETDPDDLPLPATDLRRSTDEFSASDIDAALAAVSAMGDLLTAPPDAVYSFDDVEVDDYSADAEDYPVPDEPVNTLTETPRVVPGTALTRPSLLKLGRGQPAALLPGLLLIAAGAYWMFTLTLASAPLAPGLMTLGICAAVGVVLLAYWLNSGRWARGALFAGLLLILGGAAVYLMPGLPLVWLGAIGVAALLTGLLARPIAGRLLPIGLALLLAAVYAWAQSAGVLPSAITGGLARAWVIVLPVMAVLLLIGIITRRRAV